MNTRSNRFTDKLALKKQTAARVGKPARQTNQKRLNIQVPINLDPSKRGRGRPPSATAKSTDARYTQTSIYVDRDVLRQVKAVLTLRGEQLSDIVGSFLEGWLKRKGKAIGRTT